MTLLASYYSLYMRILMTTDGCTETWACSGKHCLWTQWEILWIDCPSPFFSFQEQRDKKMRFNKIQSVNKSTEHKALSMHGLFSFNPKINYSGKNIYLTRLVSTFMALLVNNEKPVIYLVFSVWITELWFKEKLVQVLLWMNILYTSTLYIISSVFKYICWIYQVQV